jgi:signal transduction histidine kinase
MDKFKNFDDLFGDIPAAEDENNLLFSESTETEEIKQPADDPTEKWKILVVDDEGDIHSVTRIALKGFTFRGKGIEFYDAYTAAEAEEILKEHPDIALILLDVVMETTNAGLDLVKVIREKLDNPYTQIIIRTGQPGQAPEREVIVSYEINDYKTKTELTSIKLFTVALASLRTYNSIRKIDELNEAFRLEIEKRIKKEKALLHAKQKAEQSDRMKTEFLQQMSKEIQAPLNLILDSSDAIKMEVKDKVNENIRQMFDNMYFSGKRIIRAVQLILDLSEVYSEKYKLSKSKINLPELVEELIEESRYLASEARLDVIVQNDLKNSTISGDPYTIRQVLSNIIDNAFKYTSKGSIQVILSSDGEESVWAEIIDTGPGISSAFLSDLFKPFARERIKENNNQDGLGLGLALTKKYCDLNNLKIEVDSKKGQGTKISVVIPV